MRARVFGWLARRLGSLVVLGLVQRAEAAGDYDRDPDATSAMAADEQTHELVVAGLAQRARARASGWFRAAVFGARRAGVQLLAGAGHGRGGLIPPGRPPRRPGRPAGRGAVDGRR